jgi:FkbM family methyltransferase
MPKAKLGAFEVEFDNSEEYHHLKSEIFTANIYYFETDNARPRIIDAGAHIGMATLYFKRLFPGSIITAIEPHGRSFKLLENNIWNNDLSDVTTVNVALSNKIGETDFYSDVTDEQWVSTAGFHPGAWNGQQQSKVEKVPTRLLGDFIDGHIDLLKMDIEGAEQRVLMAAVDKLPLVNKMIIEFHPTSEQSLLHLVEFLEEHGFKLSYWQNNKAVVKPARGLVLIEANQN